jgi:hypothetical protein
MTVESLKKIAVFGVPRSGTSWLGEILNSHQEVLYRYQPLFSHGHKGKLHDRSTGEEIDAFFEEIRYSTDEFALRGGAFHQDYPIFLKSESPKCIAFKETRYLNIIPNLLEQANSLLLIGILRHPIEVLHSWMNAPKEFAPNWDIRSEWRDAPLKNQNRPEEYYGYHRWKEAYFSFSELEARFPSTFKMVRYSTLRANTIKTTEEIFSFCGLGMSAQIIDFIEESSKRHDENPYSVFRSRAGKEGWKRELPKDIIYEIERDLEREDIQFF